MGNGRRVALVLGLVAVVIALGLSFATVRASGNDCGNVWSRKTSYPAGTEFGDFFSSSLANLECDRPLKDRRITSGVLGALGLALVLVAVIKPRGSAAARPPAASDGTI